MKTEMRFWHGAKFQNALGVFVGVWFLVGVAVVMFIQIPLDSNSKAMGACLGKVVAGGVLLYFAFQMLFQERRRFTSHDHIFANLIGGLLFLGGVLPIFQVVSFLFVR